VNLISHPTRSPRPVLGRGGAAQEAYINRRFNNAHRAGRGQPTFGAERQSIKQEGGNDWGARQKLNSAYVTGSLFVAGIVGLATRSWIVFLIVAAVLIAGGFNDGTIRPTRRRR